MKKESVEVKIARIDLNVKNILETIPMIRRHDRELFAIKIILGASSPIFMFWLAHRLGIQIF